MLLHYVEMRSTPFPADVGDRIYEIVPKWAYLYWYWHDYRPFFCWYAIGLLPLLILVLRRKVSPGAGSLLVFAAVLLGAAHKAHIIGPEYLAHCLPFLTLIGGYAFYMVSRRSRGAGLAALLGAALLFIRWHAASELPGMDARSQQPRWPEAAAVLARTWQPRSRLVMGPQWLTVGQWYLIHGAGAPAREGDIGELPGGASPAFLAKMRRGYIRYIVVSSTFMDSPSINAVIASELARWSVVWRSDEKGSGPSRLTVYEWRPEMAPTRAEGSAPAGSHSSGESP